MFPKVSVSALTRHVKHCEGKTTHAGEKTETCSIKVLLLFYIDKVQLKKIPWGIAVDWKPLPRRLELLYAEANGRYNVLRLGLKRATKTFSETL